MSITDHEGRIQVNYSQETAFKACKEACKVLDGFSIQKIDDVAHTLYIKSGMSLFSWGEVICVSVIKVENYLSEIIISSAPKIGMGANAPGLMGDMGKNRKNINMIQQIVSEQLSKYPIEVQVSQSKNVSITDEIVKLAELKTSGIITEQEFQEMKKKIINQ